jgi:hypothetical protein
MLSSRSLALVAALGAVSWAGVVSAQSTEDAGKRIANFGHVKQVCSTLEQQDSIYCAHFVIGFIESMAFHEQIYSRTPTCVQDANWHSLANEVIKRIRESQSKDPWTGLQLANMVMGTLGCTYEPMTK